MKKTKNYVTKEQLQKMRQELIELTTTCDRLLGEMQAGNTRISCSIGEFNDLADYLSLEELYKARARKQEIESILKFVEIIPEEKDEEETIKVGSTFKVNFGGEEEDTFTLVETLTCLSVLDHYISLSSPLGKNVYGKKVGDDFSYAVNGIQIDGSIIQIVKIKEKILK